MCDIITGLALNTQKYKLVDRNMLPQLKQEKRLTEIQIVNELQQRDV